jgi:hypothetical protein
MAYWGHRDAAARTAATEAPEQGSEEDELEERVVFHNFPQRLLPRKKVLVPAVGAKRKLNFKSTKRGTGKQVCSVKQKATLDNQNYRTNGETRKQRQQSNDFLQESGITLTQQRAADQPPRIRSATDQMTAEPSDGLSQDILLQALLESLSQDSTPGNPRDIRETQSQARVSRQDDPDHPLTLIERIEETQDQSAPADNAPDKNERLWVAVSVKLWGPTKEKRDFHLRWLVEGTTKRVSSWETWDYCVELWGEDLMQKVMRRGNARTTRATNIVGATTRSAARAARRNTQKPEARQPRKVATAGKNTARETAPPEVKRRIDSSSRPQVHHGRHLVRHLVFKSPGALTCSLPGPSPGESIRFRATGSRCVPFALFNLCHHRGTPLSKKERCRVMTALRQREAFEYSSLTELAGVRNRKVWHLERPKDRRATAARHDSAAWLFHQHEGLFLVANETHCVGIDCEKRIVLDCSREHPLPLTESWRHDCDLMTGTLAVRRLVMTRPNHRKENES